MDALTLSRQVPFASLTPASLRSARPLETTLGALCCYYMRENPYNIYIDEKIEIQGVDISDSREEIVNCDNHIAKLKDLFESLQRHCVIECCGIDALDLAKESITKSCCYNAIYLKELRAARININNDSAKILEFELINAIIHKDTMLALLDYLIGTFDECT